MKIGILATLFAMVGVLAVSLGVSSRDVTPVFVGFAWPITVLAYVGVALGAIANAVMTFAAISGTALVLFRRSQSWSYVLSAYYGVGLAMLLLLITMPRIQ